MTTPETRSTAAGAAPRRRDGAVAARPRAIARSRWLFVALLALIAAGAFWAGRSLTPVGAAQPLPAYVGLPPHARLVWYDDHLDARVEDWNYAVLGATNESLAAFYEAHLPRDDWQCVRMTTSTQITRNGVAYSGTSIYITALHGGMKAQIYTADQEYGAFLLQGDLPANAVALRISLETEDHPQCV